MRCRSWCRLRCRDRRGSIDRHHHAALTVLYTFEGGLAAVIWTDVVQTFIYVGGTLVGLTVILHLVPGGWTSVEAIAGALHKFAGLQTAGVRFHLGSALAALEFWQTVHILGGCDWRHLFHDGQPWHRPTHRAAPAGGARTRTAVGAGAIVQRAESRSSFSLVLFLTVGIMLWAYYRVPSSTFGRPDRIYPTFIVTRMPHGISGLLIAAILAAAMSNLSAALNSPCRRVTIMDFSMRGFVPWLRREPSPICRMRLARPGHGGMGAGAVLWTGGDGAPSRWDAWWKLTCRSLRLPMERCWECSCWEC